MTQYIKREWKHHYYNNGDGDRFAVYTGDIDEPDICYTFATKHGGSGQLATFLNQNETALEMLNQRIEQLESAIVKVYEVTIDETSGDANGIVDTIRDIVEPLVP